MSIIGCVVITIPHDLDDCVNAKFVRTKLQSKNQIAISIEETPLQRSVSNVGRSTKPCDIEPTNILILKNLSKIWSYLFHSGFNYFDVYN